MLRYSLPAENHQQEEQDYNSCIDLGAGKLRYILELRGASAGSKPIEMESWGKRQVPSDKTPPRSYEESLCECMRMCMCVLTFWGNLAQAEDGDEGEKVGQRLCA